MEIIYPPAFFPTLKSKHLLLDTNIFRDAALNPDAFNNFFFDLKKADVTITTIDLVKYEILKGSSNKIKYETKDKWMDDIIDAVIPLTPDTYKIAYNLIKMYEIEGTSLHITDLLLGATLMMYKKNIYLITRDTSDFLQSIFDLSFIVTAAHNKGILAYGVYQYTK